VQKGDVKMEKRKCFNCDNHIPPETDHYEIDGEVYCTDCVTVEPYTAYQYFLDGEYKGDSEGNGDVDFVESYDDEYEEN
jgi:hypothetical protein